MWPLYYPNGTITDKKKIQTINDSIQSIDYSCIPFIHLQDFIDMFYKKKELSELELANLPEKCAKSFTAKGFLMFNENHRDKFIITDLNWFSKVMNLIVKPENISDKLVDMIPFDNAPLWELNRLKESLRKYLHDDNINCFIEYLIEQNLVVKIENQATQSTFILPCSNIPEQPSTTLVILKLM